ncbi:MAG TPA: helix-turn-helix transcriptional regulator [Candidatus Limnocylindria bacterium]|jgi:cytoskeleton protein RodZ|nr:helix-turn-helix transcriptional regulator [Candidatus Limnocylindria bacterium]
MPTVGEQFRAERERQKLTVHQVADATNIKTDHVRALEDSNWSAFAAPVYIRGFARTYARLLKLDAAPLVTALEAELGQTDDYAGPPSLERREKGPLDAIMLLLSRVKWQWVFPVLLVAILLLVGYWAVHAWRQKPAHEPVTGLGSGLYQPKKTGTGTLPLPTNAPAGKR